MFFRRERPVRRSFQDKLNDLRAAGFTVSSAPSGASRVSRGCFAVDIKEHGETLLLEERAGIVMGDEIGLLTDGGFQKFFFTKSGKKRPALADDLKGLHDFEEDVKETLGLKSLYNESLGTISTQYLYDRVKDRDRGVPKRAWEEA